MGNAWMMRRSGGANPLNFSVYAGSAEPEQPQENMIWIAADLDVPKWAIAEENPFLSTKSLDWLNGAQTANGFLANNGSISSQSSSEKEVYTPDYIPVQHGKAYRYTYAFASGAKHDQWFAVCEYTSEKVFIRRKVVVNDVSGASVQGEYTPTDTAVAYVRLSWRTFGEAVDIYFVEPDYTYTPDDVAYGTLWIKTSMDGAVAFNALRENILPLRPVKASFWNMDLLGDGGMWWDAGAKIYQDGAWIALAEE